MIEIDNPYPGEPKWMRKRKGPAVLRYHKSKRDTHYEDWMLKELMLYTPYREEDLNDYEEDTAKRYLEKEKYIAKVKSKVMEHLESVEEARYMVEQSKKELDLEEIGMQMDANLEQENADCQEEGMIGHPDFEHLDTAYIEDGDTVYSEKLIFKKISIPSLPQLREETRKLDIHQREILNICIKYAKDVVKSRREGNLAPEPIYVVGHGGAGAGKSTVIDKVSKWCHHILVKEGDDDQCPYIIKTAFTGTAASNIDGQTLNTSFGFSFDNKYYSLSDKTRDQKRRLLSKLKIIIIDEVSMVKSDMLYQLDLTLQEIKEQFGVPFGGVSLVVFGDLLQLKPVMGMFPFQIPKNPDFHATYEYDNRWKKFQILNLEINHRQGEDKQYAEMLNRIRVGNTNEEDIKQLKKRVRPAIHPDMKGVSLYILPKRKTCATYNNKFLKSLKGEIITSKAVHYHSTQKIFKPFIEEKDGSVGPTSFVDELNLKIGAKIIIINNIDNSDGLTNGQLGVLVAVIRTTTGKLDKLVMKPARKDVGIENRRRHPGLARKHPDCVFIDRVSYEYSIRKKGGSVGTQATVVQFPIRLAFAITAHKIQGQTIPKPLKVALMLDEVFQCAQGYVMLSRVQSLDQVYIIKKFNVKKLYPSNASLRELERMNSLSINENPNHWWKSKENDDVLKVVSLNCAGLRSHFADIITDHTLLQADVIHLIETSLQPEDDEKDLNIIGYKMISVKVGLGKGLTTYIKEDKLCSSTTIKSENYQVIKIQHNSRGMTLNLLNLYRSQQGNSLELLHQLQGQITLGSPTFISGDFNICSMENSSNRLVQGLLSMNFQQLVHEPTHIKGRYIDHAYLHDHDGKLEAQIYRYSPYYSDHDGICTTLKFKNMNDEKK